MSDADILFAKMRTWQNTKWICFSSTFFMVPALCDCICLQFIQRQMQCPQYQIQRQWLSLLMVTATIISILYWQNAIKGWRRDLDLVFAKVACFMIYIIATTTISHFFVQVLCYLLWLPLGFCYWNATKHIEQGSIHWIKYHFGFHICLFVSSAVIFVGLQM